MRRLVSVLAVLAPLSMAAVAVAVMVGSVAIPLDAVWATVTGGGSDLNHTLVFDLRLPRALSAFAVGGLLAVAGALMQILLRNPLADPYVLGLSGGAAVGALGAMLAGLGGTLVAGAAFGGALASTVIVFGVAHGSGSWTASRLLLTGVVVAAGWGAVISFMLAVSPTAKLPGMLFWLMGDMAHAGSPTLPLLLLLGVVLAAVPFGRTLNILARGPQQAAALGVSVRRAEWLLHLAAALLSAVAVTVAGSVGFVGLIVPHMLRLVIGSDPRMLLPAAALTGGTLLVLADTVARTLIAPEQLPVGVMTALLGVPVFLYLLRRSAP
jgi:iron complex transport system permease protein